MKKHYIEKYKVGDVLFMSPFIAHRSIMNKNKKISRWTLIIQIDDLTNSKHLQKSISPFEIEKFTSNLSNEKLREF